MVFAGCNSNVFFTFLTRITDGVATGIWASSVLSTYINVLEGGTDVANERVGYAQAIQGTFLAVAAIPAGWLAMHYRRDAILRVMGLLAFAAIATTSAALVLSDEAVGGYKYWLLCGGLALWGVAQANAPVLDALFADSTTTGDRSRLYTWLHMSYIVSQGVGPGVGAVMFYLSGNVWKLEVMQPSGSGRGPGERERDFSRMSRASSGRPGERGGGGGVGAGVGVGLSGGSFTADGSEANSNGQKQAAPAAAATASSGKPGEAQAATAAAAAGGKAGAAAKRGPTLTLPKTSADDASGASAPASDGPETPTFYAASAAGKQPPSVAAPSPAADLEGSITPTAAAAAAAAAATLQRSPPPIKTVAPVENETKANKKDKDGKDKKDKDKERPLTPPPAERQRLAKNTPGNDRAPGGGAGGGGGGGGALVAGVRRVSGAGGGGGREEAPPRLGPRSAIQAEIHKRRFLCLTMAWIPGVLALTDCIMGLASGMTIKFFPIFFKDAVLLPPVYVNLMYCAIPLCLSSAAFVAQRQSRLMGRVQTMVLNRGLGITLLAWIASHPNHWREPRLMVPIYIARTSIMNSIYPLQKSILMPASGRLQ
eukprot:XP_001691554.1 predicted protein [Chlamydomonas reinhardtii]